MFRFCRIVCTALGLALAVVTAARADDTDRVIATIAPVHSLVAAVMGETGTPRLLVDPGASPHVYQLKPSARQSLQRANIVFYIGDGYETFLRKTLRQLPPQVRVVALSASPGMTLLEHRTGGGWEPHVHAAHTHAATHDHHHHDHHDHSAADSADKTHHAAHDDLHLWLSPANAVVMTKAIANVLAEVYPEHAAAYAANAAAATARLRALDARLRQQLEPLRDAPFIIFHDAYQYFERDYGLKAVGSVTLQPGKDISARRLREIRARIAETGARCVFREPQFDDRMVATVTEGTGARSGLLDPLGANLTPGPDQYAQLLRQLADAVQACLAG